MSVRASWAFVRGNDVDGALGALGLMRTGEIDFFGESQIGCAQTSDWVFFLGDEEFVTPEGLSQLSAGGEAIGCHASEVVMHSDAFCYRDGRRVWAVSHKPDIAPDHLEVTGSPPVELAAIREKTAGKIAASDRSDVDYTFDVPLDLAKAICGVRPDNDPLPPEAVSYIVEPLQSGARAARQARMRERQEALTEHVQTDLFAACEALGFERLADHPAFYQFFAHGITSAFVRFRGEASEVIRLAWGFDSGAPYVRVSFFVRKGAEPRAGTSGWAELHGPAPAFWERLRGREQDPDEATKTILKARDVLAELDRHLRTGEVGPHIRPAQYDADLG